MDASSTISIIIPVYNTSRYLFQCIKSVTRQDYNNLEIILVNDASTDNSLEICKKYSENDSRIKIIDKQVNEGLELARRSGLAIASGKYIMHVDSDDWLRHRKVLSSMYHKAEETDADYVEIKAYRTFDKYGLFKRKITNKGIYGLIEQPELYDKYFLSFFGRSILSIWMVGKLYRKSFLDRINIHPMGVKMGEDLAYNLQLFPYLKKIYILSDFGYYYRYGGMTSTFNPYLLPDLKRLHIHKMNILERVRYDEARMTVRRDFKNILKSDIQQRIRFKHNRADIIRYLEEEIVDPVYLSLLDIEKESSFWTDPFVEALEHRDVERMYDICRHIENTQRFKRKLINTLAWLSRKFLS